MEKTLRRQSRWLGSRMKFSPRTRAGSPNSLMQRKHAFESRLSVKEHLSPKSFMRARKVDSRLQMSKASASRHRRRGPIQRQLRPQRFPQTLSMETPVRPYMSATSRHLHHKLYCHQARFCIRSWHNHYIATTGRDWFATWDQIHSINRRHCLRIPRDLATAGQRGGP